jgi:meromycolic acid enoyl-[acyl-carrier-protein] reductase
VILTDKRLVITGVLTRHSIAYAVAEQAQLAGAEVILTSFGRGRRMTERAARRLPRVPDVLELDVTNDEHFDDLAVQLRERWGGVDGALHAVAFAPIDALGGNFLRTPADAAATAFNVSAFSLKSLTEALLPLMVDRDHGSVVGLDFDASVVWPVYDWMGVAKAALESVSRYLSHYVGPHGVRVNLVSAGPLATTAAGGIPGFELMAEAWDAQAPLGWDANDPSPVAQAVCFLLSDWARGISGEIVHVDGGAHVMGAGFSAAAAGHAGPVPDLAAAGSDNHTKES